jgi:hypothetical protein
MRALANIDLMIREAGRRGVHRRAYEVLRIDLEIDGRPQVVLWTFGRN